MGAEPRGASSPVEIAVAVVQRDGHFLIGLRPPDVALGGLWEFPGGKVEVDETLENAAVRECLEETGLVVRVVGRYEPVDHQYAHGTLRLNFFACAMITERGPLPPRFRWVARAELDRYEFPPANAGLLRELIDRPRSNS